MPGSLELGDGTVTLRGWRREDAPALAPVCGDPDVCTFTSVPWAFALRAAGSWVARQERKRAEGEALVLAITRRGEARPVGTVSLTGLRDGGESAGLGYWLVPEARGRGLAGAAARLLCEWGFGELGLRGIELQIRPGNLPSRALAERLGATEEGLRPSSFAAESRLWDMVLYSLAPPSRPAAKR